MIPISHMVISGQPPVVGAGAEIVGVGVGVGVEVVGHWVGVEIVVGVKFRVGS